MTITVNLYLFQIGHSAENGINFHFAQSGTTVTFDGHIKTSRGDGSGITFNICHARFEWEKEPMIGNFHGTFPTKDPAISIFENKEKTKPVPMDGTSEFGLPVISNQGKTLHLPNANLTTNTYHYKLGISLDGENTYFPLDPMIRNTGPRTFIDALIRPVALILEAIWKLLGRPYAKSSPYVKNHNN